MKIKDYRIVKGSAVPMELEVRKHLKDGWVPQGGLVVEDGMFYQAMVLVEEESTKEEIASEMLKQFMEKPIDEAYKEYLQQPYRLGDIPSGFKVVDPPDSKKRREILEGEDIQASGGARTKHGQKQ